MVQWVSYSNRREEICALTDNQISNYWVSSGKYDSIFTYIRYDIDEIQDNLTLMFAGGNSGRNMQQLCWS